jgi:hypothetical protein
LYPFAPISDRIQTVGTRVRKKHDRSQRKQANAEFCGLSSPKLMGMFFVERERACRPRPARATLFFSRNITLRVCPLYARRDTGP